MNEEGNMSFENQEDATGLFGQPVTTRTDDPDIKKVVDIVGEYNEQQLRYQKLLQPWWRDGWGAAAGLFLVTTVNIMWAALFGWVTPITGFLAGLACFILGLFCAMMRMAGGQR